MGSFSSKDGHGNTGHNLDMFQTPPTSPVTFSLPPHTQITPSTPAQSAGFAQDPAPSTAPVPTSATALNVRRPVPISPGYSVIGPGFIYPQGRTGNDVAGIQERVEVGHNGGPVSSTPKTPLPEGKSVSISPTNSPLSLGQVIPSGEICKDSGLCQSLLEGHWDADSLQTEMEKLVEECRTALDLTPSQYAVLSSADVLKRLLLDRQELTAELQSLRETTQTERGEWLQFQADLQVAVAVADRLRAEADEELSALRVTQKDTEQQLAAAKHRQKETDEQLVTLRGDLRECRQKLAQLSQNQGSGLAPSQAKTQSQESATGETSTSDVQEGMLRGRDRCIRRQGRERGHEDLEKRSKEAGMESVLVGKAWADTKGVVNRDLNNTPNEERSREEGHGTKERSRSLSRLPVTSDSLTVQNGTSQSNTATIAGSANKSQSQTIGRRGLEHQDSWSITHTGKQDEALNQLNLRPEQTLKTRSQDGFSLLLRRHGGSRRNSLLRWCQSRTQGYKNIDITNFSSSWADGLAFCAVYHTYLPSHIPYSTLTPDSKRENLNLAFKTGENVGIPTSVTIEEMLRPGGPDWQRVLGYVESIYRHFEM